MQEPNSYPASELPLGAASRLVFIASVLVSSLAGQNHGPTFGFGLHPTDVFSTFSLPALPDTPGGTLAMAVAALQVGHRANASGLSSASPIDAWQAAQALLTNRQAIPATALAELQVIRLPGLGLAPIMIHRGTTRSIVQNNSTARSMGFSNVSAGIVITDREVDLTSNFPCDLRCGRYWAITQPMIAATASSARQSDRVERRDERTAVGCLFGWRCPEHCIRYCYRG